MDQLQFDIDNKGASIGQQQIGGTNVMTNFASLIDSKPIQHSESSELRNLIMSLRRAIEASEELKQVEREKTIEELNSTIQELQKPQGEQNEKKLKNHWARIIDLVKDVSILAGLAKAVAELLKL